ncbi:MAG TPA: helix-turn-helix domain-containing protein [bacterium]|nr:helix-turn-helix domain-containing protein [bacterium]
MVKKLKPIDLEVVVRSPSQIGAAIQRFRKLAAWTQRQAGDSVAIKQALVSRVEAGVSGTSLGTLFKLLAGLDLELVVRKRKKAGSLGTKE